MDNAVVGDAVEETVVGARPRRRKPVKPVVRVILAAAVCAVVVLDILSSHPSYFLLVYLALLGGSQLWISAHRPSYHSAGFADRGERSGFCPGRRWTSSPRRWRASTARG